MDDLVKRLRHSDDLNDQKITFACVEAADEIERLRRENEMLRREFGVVREVTAAAGVGGHDPHDDFSEQNNPFPVSPLRDQVVGIGRADYPAAAEVGERESTLDHIARDIKEGRFPKRSEPLEPMEWHRRQTVAATIERCAQVADDWFTLAPKYRTKENLLSRLRALKDIKE